MLRALLAALALLNGLLLAAHLGAFGDLSARDREPDRRTRQVQPERMRLLPAQRVDPAEPPPPPPPLPAPTSDIAPGAERPPQLGEAASGSATIVAAVPTACLQIEPLHEVQLRDLQQRLRGLGLAEDSWRELALPPGTQHLVIMGPFDNRAALLRKTRELARRNVIWNELEPAPNMAPSLAPGLSLGRFASADTAREALNSLTSRGVRSARVVSVAQPAGLVSLQLPSLGPSQWPPVLQLAAPANTRWRPCPGSQLPASAALAPSAELAATASR